MSTYTFYIDTSVFGGYFDIEFKEQSVDLIQAIQAKQIHAVVSSVVLKEIQAAPEHVRNVFTETLGTGMEILPLTDKALQLRDEYLQAGALHERWKDDASHVATASIHEVDALVSWNFKHLVRFDKIRIFNQVNQKHGYRFLQIISPLEIRLGETS